MDELLNDDEFSSLSVKQLAFLSAFSFSGVIPEASDLAGCSRKAVWEWRQENPLFLKGFNIAKQIYAWGYLNTLESELKKRALDPKSPMSTIALIFALKSEDPMKYREKVPDTKLIGDITIKLAYPPLEYPSVKVLTVGGEDAIQRQGTSQELCKGGDEAKA